MIDLTSFVEKFQDLFSDADAAIIQAGTHFHELDEWSSLQALSVIAMVDEEYDIGLKGDDITTAETVEDLFNKVISKM